jgi:hypothetical protein
MVRVPLKKAERLCTVVLEVDFVVRNPLTAGGWFTPLVHYGPFQICDKLYSIGKPPRKYGCRVSNWIRSGRSKRQ